METILAYATNTFVLCALSLVAGVVFSQKIKDSFAGIDSETRSAIKSLEGTVQSKLAEAKAKVLAEIVPPVAAPVVPPAVAPVAPVAPPAAPAAH